MSMTVDVNNMADQAGSPNQDALLKEAQDQVAQVMNNAMGNISEPDGRQMTEDNNEDIDYVEPMQNPYNKAITYLENHNILQLFQQLTASIVYTKPERPLEFMMQQVEKMKSEKEREAAQKKS